jgi:electron transport complex protein RnfB
MPTSPERPITADEIDAILPQTQCGQCAFAGCRPYAEAMARGEADINRCPPGGEAGIRRLAALTGHPFRPFAPDGPQPKPRMLAVINEQDCIGCTLCLQACPVDAILGAAKQMHTVIADECTGCELCVAPCPVDVISMIPLLPEENGYPRADLARIRHQRRLARQQQEREEKARRQAERSSLGSTTNTPVAGATANTLDEQKKAVIAAAMRRAAERQAARKDGKS